MKILLISEYYRPHIGGVEVWLENVARVLAKLGHEAHIVTCKFPGTAEYEEQDGFKIYRIPVPRWGRRYWFNFLCIPKAWKLAGRCDIVHTPCQNNIFPAWLVGNLRRKRKIVTVNELWGSMWSMIGMSYLSAKVHQALERILIALPFDKHICVSRYTRNCLRLYGVKDEKLKVIYNGINNSLFDPEKAKGSQIREKLNLKNEFVYMCYGRPGITKGIHYLIQAVPLISEKIPRSKLMLILTDDPKDRYNTIVKLIRESRIENDMLLLKSVPRNELPDYIAAADCVVVPSISEGFGYTTAEACTMGKPVVATDVGSLPEVVSGRYVLVEPRNPEAIAEGVRMIYENEVKNTDKKIFSWDECVREYLRIYKALLEEIH